MKTLENLDRFLCERLRDMERDGGAWGPPIALESQFLQNLEYLAILRGHAWSGVLVVWEGILEEACLNPKQPVSNQTDQYVILERLLPQLRAQMEGLWIQPVADS